MKKSALIIVGVFLLLSAIVLGQTLIVKSDSPLTDPELFNSLGDYLVKNNHISGAVTAYEKALELDPQNTATLNNLGYLYKDSNPLLAESYFLQAIEIDPSYENARNNLALLYNNNKEYGKAAEQLKALVNLDPGNINYNYDLAINLANSFYYETRSYDDLVSAIDYFKIVYGMDSSFMHVLDNIKVLEDIRRSALE